jgi:hypothetical protein
MLLGGIFIFMGLLGMDDFVYGVWGIFGKDDIYRVLELGFGIGVGFGWKEWI